MKQKRTLHHFSLKTIHIEKRYEINPIHHLLRGIQMIFSTICLKRDKIEIRSNGNEPSHEKTNNLSFRPGATQTGLYIH